MEAIATTSFNTGRQRDVRRVSVLGATGSIGLNTLDLIERNSGDFDVVALTANRNVDLLARLAITHRAEYAVIADPSLYQDLKQALSHTSTKVAAGEEEVARAAMAPADWVMAAIVGAAGVRPTFEAIKQGSSIALANKECLVAASAMLLPCFMASNVDLLARLAITHRAEYAVIADPSLYQDLKQALSHTSTKVAAGEEEVARAAMAPADWVMAAIVGAAGVRPTFEAIKQGSSIALANKECLVAAGEIFMDEIAARGVSLIPVDSEHSAVFQAIDQSPSESISRIILTASGGPFREWSQKQIGQATLADALSHPNWSMGRKISVDSASMMNKGLELIEAHHLFPVAPNQLEVIVHPQSIVHSLVEYDDGSVLAQMSNPDMRTPIGYALSWPGRMKTPTEKLDLVSLGNLTFEAPDEDKFPCLAIARATLNEGGAAPTILNAANEVAVAAFISGTIGFTSIPAICETSLSRICGQQGTTCLNSLDDVFAVDKLAREVAESLIDTK